MFLSINKFKFFDQVHYSVFALSHDEGYKIKSLKVKKHALSYEWSHSHKKLDNNDPLS